MNLIAKTAIHWFALSCFLCAVTGYAQSTIASQDFESSPATPTLTYTNTNGSISTGNGSYPSDPLYSGGSRGFKINNETATVEFGSVDVSLYTSIELSFRLASFSSTSGNGADGGDKVSLSISTDNGNSWSEELILSGNTNAKWSFTSGTGSISQNYDGDNSATNYAPSGGGYQTTEGYSTIALKSLPSSSTLKIRLEFNNNDAKEYWIIDDMVISGILASSSFVGFDAASSNETETNANQSISIPVTLSNYSSFVKLDVTVNGSSTAESGDYILNTTSLSFNSSGTQNIDITIKDDADADHETIILDITENPNSGIPFTTDQHTITVTDDEAVVGLQLTALNTAYTIDFDNTVNNVNNGNLVGGFAISPTSGELDADAWATEGLADGDKDFSVENTSGDHNLGVSSGGVGTGGLYSFEVSTNNYALGFQPTGSDLTPGKIILKAQNNSGSVVTAVRVVYTLYELNNANRSTEIEFQHSTDNSTYSTVSDLTYTSVEANDSPALWRAIKHVIDIPISISDGDYLYLGWALSDNGGSGSMDEFALDDIEIIMGAPGNYSLNNQTFDELNISNTPCEITSGNTEVDGKITNNGTITINDGAALIQIAEDDSNSGTGNYVVSQTVNNAHQYRFNYWSSPVKTTNMQTVFAASNPNHFYYYDPTKDINKDYSWENQSGSANMTPGVGYITTADIGANNATITYSFSGKVNNGTVSADVSHFGTVNDGDNDWNLLGNPYPSTIDFDLFSDDNDHMNTTVYIWDSPNNSYISYTVGSGSNPYGFYGQIAACQGFFVERESESKSTVKFKNKHRSDSNNVPFYKSELENQSKFWLGAYHEDGYRSSLLVVFNDNAYDDYDALDGKLFQGNSSLEIGTPMGIDTLETTSFPFLGVDEVKVIPIMFTTEDSAQFKFKMDRMQNVEERLNIYLKDNFNDTIIDIVNNEYSFYTYHIGPEASRFELILDARTDHLLSQGAIINNGEEDSTTATVSVVNQEFKVQSLYDSWIISTSTFKSEEEWFLYDVSGRLIQTYHVKNGILKINHNNLSSKIYVLKSINTSVKLIKR